MTCGNCRYFDGISCRRYAPRPRILTQPRREADEETIWPLVNEEGWCGEYEPRTDDQLTENEKFERSLNPTWDDNAAA